MRKEAGDHVRHKMGENERRVLGLENNIYREDVMKTITSLALVAMLSLLGSCTINPHSMDMTQAVQSARTRSDHESLAKHYDDAAKDMQATATEHKKSLPNTRPIKDFMGSKHRV